MTGMRREEERGGEGEEKEMWEEEGKEGSEKGGGKRGRRYWVRLCAG